jgi:uncharacterized 2Fe-2S/4Fe-4S cluster protein (DUF4445 family)
MAQQEHTLTIVPENRRLYLPHNTNLLKGLAAHGIFLRSDCGGKGNCGKCLVKVTDSKGETLTVKSCSLKVTKDLILEIPETSLDSPSLIAKPFTALPPKFLGPPVITNQSPCLGLAVDLGTTSIAAHLMDCKTRRVLGSMAFRNPQHIFGYDIMSRIEMALKSPGNLDNLQKTTVRAIEQNIESMLKAKGISPKALKKMVVVANPAMLHLFLGISPEPLAVAPYRPAFFRTRETKTSKLGFEKLDIDIQTLPQVSGFIGGDILGAALAAELESQPTGTLLIDIGTNGELLLKGDNGYFATSCATGPAFEGATLSCGMQALRGAIEKVRLQSPQKDPICRIIGHKESHQQALSPSGLCGSGVISAVSEFLRKGVIDQSGRFKNNQNNHHLAKDSSGGMRYLLSPSNQPGAKKVYLSQKDIRAIQLGKAALKTGILFLLREDRRTIPRKIIIAGAFGAHLDKRDILTLGMVPLIPPADITMAGNLAGAGAIMALCDDRYIQKAKEMAAKIKVLEMASDPGFQKAFVENLGLNSE